LPEVPGLSRRCFSFLLCPLALLASLIGGQAQERTEDTLRVRTRVVSVDVLVSDKKTGAPVADLTRESFEVLADGKRRTVSYFRREGENHRQPLALVLVIDLVGGGAQNYLRRPDILKSLTAALKKLPPEDEVAVMANLGGSNTSLKTLVDFTRDRAKIAEALEAVPNLPVPGPRWYVDELRDILQKVEPAAAARVDSQMIVMPLRTGFGDMSLSERAEIVARLIRANVLFSPLICDLGQAYLKMGHVPGKLPTPPRPVFDTIGHLLGRDIYSPEHIAQQTGGENTTVSKPEDFGAALEKLIASLAARYNLGFTLTENERDDGRMHKLEVRTRVRDSKGKERKLMVRARRGYYIPKVEEMPVK